jgi:hypothetical protein
MKYTNYKKDSYETTINQKKIKNKDEDDQEQPISFNKLLEKHKEKRQKWSKRIDENRLKILEESFKDLDTIKSDEVESEVPVKTETNKEIIFDKIKKLPLPLPIPILMYLFNI